MRSEQEGTTAPLCAERRLLYFCSAPLLESTACFTHVNEIVRGLGDLGWNVNLLAPPARSRRGALRRVVDSLVMQAKAVRRLNEVDVVYCRFHFLLWPIAMWLSMRGVPVVQEVNGPYEDVFVAWPAAQHVRALITAAMRMQLKRADTVITVTEQLRDWVEREAPQTYAVTIPNGANVDVFRPEAIATFEFSEPYVIFFGSLARWQGIETLLQAAEEPGWPDGVRLVVVGDGTCRPTVERAAANSRVCYLGPRTQSEVAGLVARSFASVIPKNSLGERNSTGLAALKLYESMAASVPVIVTDLPGHAELVRLNRCGIVVPVGDAPAIATAVSELWRSKAASQAMGSRGRQFVLREASWACRAAETDKALTGLTQSVRGHVKELPA